MPPKTQAKAKGKDLDAFRSRHDKSYIVPSRIKAGLAELGDSWEYELEFIRRCGLAQVDFSAYRDHFAEFCVVTPRTGGRSHGKKIWTGSKALAVKMRGML